MADDKEIELEDFDFDEFDFDEFDMGGPDAVDDRKPSAVIRDSAIEGFKSSMTNKDTIRKALEKSLPDEYESTFDALDRAGDVRDQVNEAMEPVAKQTKSLIRQNKDLVSKFLPEKMAEKLKGWSEDHDSGGYENIDPRAAETTATIADIFRLNQEKDTEEREVDSENEAERFAIKEEAETKRHMGQVEVLEAIRSGITRQTDYQDQILTRYQQKHLELTYQQLYTVQDLLDLSKRRAESDTQAFADIVKNTGLPETQKIKAFEEAKREALAEARREAVEGVGGYVRGVAGNMIGNTVKSVTNRMSETLGSIQSGLELGASAGGSPLEMIGNMMGSNIAQSVMEKGIAKALKAMGQDDDESNVKRMGARLALMWQEAPEKLLGWAKVSSGRNGMAGFFENFIKDQVPSFSRVNNLGIDLIADADEGATFTNRVARSITDVIPGYLSLQLHQLRLLVADGEPIDKIEYNPETGLFGSSSDKKETLESRLFGPRAERYQRNLKETTDSLLGDSDISDEAKQEFGDFLYDLLSQGNGAEIKSLPKALKRSSYISEENKAKLSDLLMKNTYDSKGEHYQSATLNNQTTERYKKIGDLRGSIPYIKEDLEEMIAAGYHDELMEMGILDSKGKIDHDVVAKYLSGRPDAKREEDGSFKNRLAARNRDTTDGDSVAIPSVQDSGTDMEERGRSSLWQRLTGKGQGTKEKDPAQEIVRAIVTSSDTEVSRLSQLIAGQTSQTDKMDALIASMSGTTNHTETDMRSLFETQTDALRKAILDCCVKEDATVQTDLLREILAIIPESAALGGAPGEASTPLLKSVTRRVVKFASFAGDALTAYYKGVFKLASESVKATGRVLDPVSKGAGNLLSSIGQRLTQGKEDIGDLFVKGSPGKPVIEKAKLLAGGYFDKATGKALYTVEELKAAKGDIVDKADQVVVSAEDMVKGLYTKHGKGIITKSGEWLKKYYDNLWGGTKTLLGFIPPTARAAYGMVKNILDRQVDLYVKGEQSPRILASLLVKGHYRDQNTGKAIYKHGDINGAVIDPENRVVLKMEELEKVVGPDGEPIRTLTRKGVDLVKKYYSTVWGMTKKAGLWVKDTAKDLVDGRLSIGGVDKEHQQRTTNYWEEQLQILRRLDLTFTGGPVSELDFSGIRSGESPDPDQLALPAPDGHVPKDADFDEPTPPSGGPRNKASDIFKSAKERAKGAYGKARDKVGEHIPEDKGAGFFERAKQRVSDTYGRASDAVKGKLDEPKPDVLGTVTDKVTGAFSSITDKFSGFFSKTDEHEEERNKDRDQQTGLLSKLTDLTKKRSEKQDEIQQKQMESQEKMTETLKGIEENTDKEELREGGWKSRVARMKDRLRGRGGEESEEDEPKLGKASKSMGYEKKSMADLMFGGIVKKFGEYIGSFGSIIGSVMGFLGGGKLLDKAKGWLGFGGGGADDNAGGGNGGRRGGLWSKVKSAGKWVGKTAWNVGKFAVTRALPAVAIGGAKLLGGALTFLSAPVVLGAAAVAGVAYGGYKLYQYITSYKPKVLDTLRYAHYGLDVNSEKHRKLVMPLEEYVENNLSWVDGRPKISFDKNDSTLAEILGLREDSDEVDGRNAAIWFQERFIPAWGAHRGILHNIFSDTVTLSNVDDLPSDEKLSFLEQVGKAIPGGVVSYMTSPFYDDPLSFDSEKVKATHMWAKDQLTKEKKSKPSELKPLTPLSDKKEELTPLPSGEVGSTTPGQRESSGSQPGTSGSGGSYWGGFTTKSLKEITAKSKANTKYVLSIVRYKQTRRSTLSDVALVDKGTGQKVLDFKMLERPGPDTREPNQRLRIPEGSYKLKWQTQTGLAGVRPHLPVPWLYGNGVPEDRHIYIHNGNYPKNTDGCLLCGKDAGNDMVSSSVDTLDRLKAELENIGIENVTVEVSSKYKGGSVAQPTNQIDSSVPRVGQVENWSAEETRRRAMGSSVGTTPDDRGQAPMDRSESASVREEEALSKAPKEWVNKEDIASVGATVAAKNPGKTKRELATLRDMELTRLANQRKKDWMDENSISEAAAKAGGLFDNGQPKVRSYGPFYETTESVVMRPEAPSLEDRPRNVVSANLESEQEVLEQQEAQRREDEQRQSREQQTNRQRIEKERRHTLETASRIESVLGEQLKTQKVMSDNLEKLVLLAEGRFQQETNTSPTEYLVKRGYRPPQKTKEAFKPVVDLSS